MKRRRWLIRLGIFVGILVVLSILFSIFVFNLYESDLDDLDAMVPLEFGDRQVTFVVRAPSVADLRGREFFSRRLRNSPAIADLEASQGLDQFLYDQVEEIENEIRLALKGVVDFEFEEDVFGQEVLLAGDLDPEDLPATPFLFLTRVTWKVKLALSMLRYDSVRSRLEPALQGRFRIRKERFWYELVVEDRSWKRNPDEELVYFFARERDVLAVSNDRSMIKEAVNEAKRGGARSIRSHVGYPKSLPFETEGREVAAWFDLLELNTKHDLAGVLEPDPNAPRTSEDLLFELIPPRIQYDASMSVALGDPDLLLATLHLGEVDEEGIPDHLDGFYRGEWFDVGTAFSEMSRYAPADRTVGAAAIDIDPISWFEVLWAYLTTSQQTYLSAELHRTGETMQGLAGAIGRYLRRPVCLIVTRLNEQVDALPLDHVEDGGDIPPSPAYHITMRFHDTSKIPSFVDLVVDQMRALGYVEASRRPETIEGLPDVQYYPMPLKETDPELPFLSPAMAIQGDRFFFSTNGEELQRVLRTPSTGVRTLADDPGLAGLVADGPAEAGILLVLDGPLLGRMLRDQRWQRADERGALALAPKAILRRKAEIVRELGLDQNQGREFREKRDALLEEWKDRAFAAGFEKGRSNWLKAVSNLDPVRGIVLTLQPTPKETIGELRVLCK